VQNGEDKDREIALYSMPLGMPGVCVARAELALEKMVSSGFKWCDMV